MEKTENKRFRFGLIGRNISYSFSKGYFTKKFLNLGLKSHSYENFELSNIQEFAQLNTTDILGINVTIPYKEAIIPFLHQIDPQAQKIGAVNTIKFTVNGPVGFNTDAYGFQESLTPFLKQEHNNALILGTGGASKAIAFVLEKLGISYQFVSRNPDNSQLAYTDLTETTISKHLIIINCTPLGTHPNISDKPEIPYLAITKQHLLYDLIYNPEKTAFLKEGEDKGAKICNGLSMLELQAERSWEIWNS